MGEVRLDHMPDLNISHDSNPRILPLDWVIQNERIMCDLEMLLAGGFYPLKGFLGKSDYLSVLNSMRLTSGEIWPVPIVFPIPKYFDRGNMHWRHELPQKGTVTSDATLPHKMQLRDKLGTVIAEFTVTDIYEPNIELEMLKVLGTTDTNHPYAKYLLENHRECYYLGGSVKPIKKVEHFDFTEYRCSASECRENIRQRGWEIVIGFQTRNPMHRSHFELTRKALQDVEKATGKVAHLLLTPSIGPTQIGDVDFVIRTKSYKRILSRYDVGRVVMVLLPVAMRMAGPREAVWHALIRKNFGCTHFIVGRDHAGPSSQRCDGTPFYGPYDAHDLIQSVQNELGIIPVLGKSMVFVGENHGGYVPIDKVPGICQPKSISGTQFREMLMKREEIPTWFSFPEVINELKKFYRPLCELGLCIYFTGLPCSGKSTLANAIGYSIRANEKENRKVTLLDADIIRTHLSKGLGFSRSERSLNVRRIGYVASEIVKHGGICIVANIAPYEEDRACNRAQITATSGGAYVEVYVSTPLEVCEERDIKELYRKARQGIIKQFTGISDPYQVPVNAELVINSTNDIHGKVKRIMDYLINNRWVPN
ncbi:sulfate adenylyltransferase/adenylylsulfate kinase [Cardiosporidium cionae]|uniref:Sulfate adenylyltransferase/adenylylsulfate kinase n=1 Tax=Cardiosporidium cionae TaxID=476202 RepID=A0ABQ7JCK7_9APIC|nr:sulfate adenylyltransferase/adenylylsulfate kinase [Cardiosporidium cionae]|eukprot:KAF8821624.1 sulfate adenylyltransferase/adenylylsulfate kinase [Cardiosporidium cionae]